ncbi:vesicle-associated membrane protein 1 isoform X3 [Pyrgilauda ruficollis]|uniref:vesicle-associated membrane protein 1 isoform X3 n=1 Tax=Pyrgilauda ruficollis TaxID=221976 RepID=UPI001B869A58|nr:vesicle-associated membrane protein 1 isoform X3 [Pyrgilauda ruficollis]
MSDPAQQPAPGAPEGGAPEGGAPEGAAPGGGPPGAPPNLTSNRRLQQTQAQVQEVVDIMCVNVDKVLQRDEKLSELDDRADALQAGASVFESSAAKLKRKYWWKNCKMMIMMGVIGALVVVVIASPGKLVAVAFCGQFPCSSPSKVTGAVSCLNVLLDMG